MSHRKTVVRLNTGSYVPGMISAINSASPNIPSEHSSQDLFIVYLDLGFRDSKRKVSREPVESPE